MDIEIKNEEAAISTCQQIISYNQQNAAYIESLESALQRINADWQSNGHDKESYVLELEKQIQNLKIMERGTNDLANSILKYVENIQATNSNTLE